MLVAGAGYVGLGYRRFADSRRGRDLSVAVVDAAPAGVWQKDTARLGDRRGRQPHARARLGCWDEIAREARGDDRHDRHRFAHRCDPVRPVFLTFDGEVAPGEPFAHMVANKVLNGALRRRAAELGIDIIEGVAVSSFEAGAGDACRCIWPTASRCEPRLLVAADGVKSKLRDMAGIKTVHWDYGQSGIVCTVGHERPHGGRAEEHFCRPAPSPSCRCRPARTAATARPSCGPSARRTPSGWSPPTSWCSRRNWNSASA